MSARWWIGPLLWGGLVGGCTDPDRAAGDRAWEAGRFGEARAAYARALARAPGDSRLAARLATAEEAWAERVLAGGTRASFEELQLLLERSQGRGDPWPRWRRQLRRRVAGEAARRGRPLESLAHHVVLAREWPDCPTCPALARAIARDLPDTPAARDAFRALAQAWPQELQLREELARWLADHGHREDAVREYVQLLHDPQGADDFMLQARVQVALKLLRGVDD